MTLQRFSIQSRLILLVLGTVLVVDLVAGWSGYRRAMHEADELLDAQLAQYAQIMLSLAHEGDDDEVRLPDIQAHPYQSKLMFQIWKTDDEPRLMLRSPEAPHQWPQGVSDKGYSETVIAGHAWRFLAATGHDEYVVLAAHDLHIREELAREIALSNIKPFLLALPVLAVLLLLAIRHGLAPLRTLESDLSGRDPGRLDEVPEAGLPRELRPPVRAMNRLFGRIRKAMDKERRFTSDAAHELRTPIAALRAQLQVAQRTPDPDERQSAIAKALLGTDRMTHLVSQLLALARLEAESTGHLDTRVDLGSLLREAVDERSAQAAAKGIRLQASIDAECGIMGNAELLRILLRNVLDNAIRYVREGGQVKVGLSSEKGNALLSVADDGPGVAEADREMLGQRFHRFGPQTAEGVGLGLSIVRRVAELHGAELVFGEGLDGKGLGVEVSFPAIAGTGTAAHQ
jgi:two-component system, OmpR family, sensor histidine kinase QseC